MAGGTIAELNVAINAVDNASGVIAGIAAELGGLSGTAASAASGVGNVNGVLNDTARAGRTANAAYTAAALGGTALNNSTVTAASSVTALEQRLKTQKNTTMQYAREVRNAKNDLQAKKAILESTAKTYKATTAPIKENISSLKTQQSSLKEAITARQNEISSLTDTNKGLKKSSQAYKENQKAIQWVRTELGDTQEKYRKVSNEISVQEAILKGHTATYREAQANVKAAAQSHEELRAKMKESSAAEKEITAAIEKGDAVARGSVQTQTAYAAAQSASAVKTALTAEEYQKSGKIIKEYGEGVDTLIKPLQTAAVVALGLGTASTVAAVKFEDDFANVKKTVEGTPEQLEAVRKGIIDMTTVGINGHGAIPQTTAQLTELAAAGGQLGIQTENILDFTETMAMLGSATNLQGETGAQTLARFMNVANVSQKDIGRLGSAIVDLGNNFATTEAEIANMAMDMGATGATVGMSAQDILGYATAMSSMGIEAAAGGSALQRIWMDMQNSVSKGGDRLEAFAKVSGKSSKEFQKQWKEDATGAFNDFLKGLNNSPDQVGLLNALDFNNVRDQRALLALAGEKGFDILTEAIKRSNKAWEENTALQTEFENKQQTTASQIQIAKNNAVEAARSFGEVLLPTVVDVTGGLSGAARGLASLDDNSKKALVTTGAFVIGLGAVSKGTVGVIKGIGNTADALGKIKKAKEAGGVLADISPTLAGMATAAVPAAVGIAAVTTATYSMYKAARAYEDYRADWSRGGDELAEKMQNSAEAARELNNLQYELRTLTAQTKNPNISEADLVSAQARIEAIKQTLSQKYQMNIEVNDSQLDTALEKQKKLEYYNAIGNIPNATKYLTDNEKDFENAKRDKKNTEDTIAAIKNQQNATKTLKADLIGLKEQYDNGSISQQEFTQGIRNLAKEVGDPRLADMPLNELLTGTAIDNHAQRLADNLKTNQDLLTQHEITIGEYKKAAEELADTGLLQMEWGNTEQGLYNISEAVKKGGLDIDEYAKKTANVKTGVSDMSEAVQAAWEGNGEKLQQYTNNYIDFAKQFGASTETAVQGAALIKEGFANVSEVGNNADSIQAVVKSLQELGSQQGLDMSASKLTEMAQSMNLIPESKHIEFTAEGNISVIDDMKNAVDELNSTGAVKLGVSADGDISVLDTASAKLQELAANGDVKITFNAETKGFDISDLDGNVIGTMEIDGTIHWKSGEVEEPETEADGTVNYKTGEVEEPEAPTVEGTITWSTDKTPTFDSLPGFEEIVKEAKVNYTGNFDGVGDAPPKNGIAKYTGDFSGVGGAPELHGTIIYDNIVYPQGKPHAQGTQYFGGGLAMVNDELGRADKRELIIDQGRAFIPQGENVVLPLSKGAKVYTATQTQRILKSLGIAQYAGGKDNDDILGTLQSLGLNGINVQKAMPDNVRTNAEWLYEWKNGGSMAGAPNSKDFELAKEKFDHEKKTRAMSTTEELQKWIEFSKQFNETEKDIAVIEEQIFSLTSKISDELNKQSAAWIEDRVALNDWQGYGDNAIAAFDRVKERNYKDFQDGLMTWQEYTDTISDLGSDMYSGRIKHSKAWLEHEENYNDMSTDDYLAGIDRMKAYTEEYYAKGLINHREYVEGKIELDEMEADKKREQYEEWKTDADAWETMRDTYGDWGESGNENNKEEFLINKIKRVQEALAAGKLDRDTFTADMNQYKMDVFKYREEMYDDFLSQRKDYISDLKDEFAAEEKALQDSWTVENRKADMSEVSEQLYIYSDAVTDRGQQKYKELQEQMKQLQRDEELYQLQIANNKTIEALEEEYKQLEADKSVFLKGIKDNFDVDISGLLSGFEQSNNTINRTLGDIINAINNIKMEQTVYSDSRKIQNNIRHVSGELYDKIIASVSGR